MVFHVLPILGIVAGKWVIKELADAPECIECGKEKHKMWFGFKLVYVCRECEDRTPIVVGNLALKVISLGVRIHVGPL